MSGFTVYDILYTISFSMIAVVFYKIFVNSIGVLQDFTKHKVFSIEEVLGASLMLAIAITCFENLSIFGFSIRNVLSILIVLILGWKNGILVGTTAGVTIGVTLGVITSSDPMQVAAFAISGMIAGILNRFGKPGVIIGFCLGNIVLAYVSNGYTVELIHFKEILVASIGLLAVPKSIKINIEEFIGNSKFFPVFPNRALTNSKEMATKLNNVSETIDQMAESYKTAPSYGTTQSYETAENYKKTQGYEMPEGYKTSETYKASGNYKTSESYKASESYKTPKDIAKLMQNKINNIKNIYDINDISNINDINNGALENEENKIKIENEKNKEKAQNKEIFVQELLDNLEGYEQNMLYDDISQVDGIIVDKIFNTLLDKQKIERKDLLTIFQECNSYIVGFDDTQISSYLEENITQMLRVINMSYKISKTNFVWMKRLEENKKNMQVQLKGVSKAISNLAQDIEKDIKEEEKFEPEKRKIIELLKQKEIQIQEISIKRKDRFLIEIYLEDANLKNIETFEKILSEILGEKIVYNEEASLGNRLNFLSEDKFVMAIGISETSKNKTNISGDSILNIRLKDGKYLVALSDGMGSGSKAKESSKEALKMLENLLLSGFDKTASIELINTSLINKNEEIFATLDIAIIDLYTGTIEFIKSRSLPNIYKKRKKSTNTKSKLTTSRNNKPQQPTNNGPRHSSRRHNDHLLRRNTRLQHRI